MDSFWSKLLILGIVAAIGLFFIGNVYNPQKTAQQAMADSTQQSVNAVKAGVEDSAPSIVKGDSIISTVNQYCGNGGGTINIIVQKVDGSTYTFKNSTSSDSCTPSGNTNKAVTSVALLDRHYVKEVTKSATQISSIKFVEQSN